MTIVLFLATPASAHHFWIDKDGNEFIVSRGKISERSDSYDPSCIKEILAYGSDGTLLRTDRVDKPNQVRFTTPTAPAMATATSQWGYRVKTTEGKKMMTREEALSKGLTVLSAFFSTHFVKSLFTAACPVGRAVGQKFEIILFQNPLAPTGSDFFQVQLIYDGKPLPGASIFTQNDDKSITDENGMARIPLPGKKPFLIYSKHWVEAKDRQDIDRLVFTTFLSIVSDK
ncbi:MAG: DUF4198 domain-containing protein [Desulfobacterales bacterium]|nr:DUF4198 domain-containing protein [Desulfobacterales bacterium]